MGLTHHMLTIGPWDITNPTILAPMAGVTDPPFRRLCRDLGAGMAVSEMITSDERLWSSRKSQRRLASHHCGEWAEKEPRSVQLAGNDPAMMAAAAASNAAMGAQIIDINMGCPAKKVCKKAAGSALLRDEVLVKNILEAVVCAVEIPVTLKIRTGWSPQERNGLQIARIAEDCGIQALAVHGRTRACAFKGDVEYDTIATIVDALSIPVFANGDITSPQKAKAVLQYTGAAAVMVGRGAQGNPWIFREINHYLSTGNILAKPKVSEICAIVQAHLAALHKFYGDAMGVKIARKHIAWYLQTQTGGNESFRRTFNTLESPEEQHIAVQDFFEQHQLTIEELKEDIAA